MADAYGSVSSTIDADKRALLSAVATGGSAGAQAFQDAQAQLAAAQQAAVGRAASRAALIGGPEAQGFQTLAQDQYGRGISNLGTASATFGADMARRGQAFGDYLSKAQAAIPAYQAETGRLVALKQAAAQAAAAKKSQDDISLSSLLGYANKAQMEADAASNGAVDFGPGLQPGEAMDHYLARLNKAADTRRTQIGIMNAPKEQLAEQIGQKLGVPDTKLAALYAPSTLSGLQSAQYNLDNPRQPKPAPLTPDEKWLTSNVRGLDAPAAKQVLAAPEFKMAAPAAQDIAAQPLDADGLLGSDYEGGLYEGLTPREAFKKWMLAQQGTRTMKDAAIQYYGGYLDNMTRK